VTFGTSSFFLKEENLCALCQPEVNLEIPILFCLFFFTIRIMAFEGFFYEGVD